jgi:hypothetical protein
VHLNARANHKPQQIDRSPCRPLRTRDDSVSAIRLKTEVNGAPAVPQCGTNLGDNSCGGGSCSHDATAVLAFLPPSGNDCEDEKGSKQNKRDCECQHRDQIPHDSSFFRDKPLRARSSLATFIRRRHDIPIYS